MCWTGNVCMVALPFNQPPSKAVISLSSDLWLTPFGGICLGSSEMCKNPWLVKDFITSESPTTPRKNVQKLLNLSGHFFFYICSGLGQLKAVGINPTIKARTGISRKRFAGPKAPVNLCEDAWLPEWANPKPGRMVSVLYDRVVELLLLLLLQ